MKNRNEIAVEDRWNLEQIYPSLDTWKEEFDSLKKDGSIDFSKIKNYKGRLGESPEVLKLALNELLSLERKLSRLYTYVHLRHDEDVADNTFKGVYGEIQSTLFNFYNAISWFDPELLSLSDSTQKMYLDSEALREYRFLLEKTFRLKKHTLTAEMESICALAMKGMQTSPKAFTSMNDADIKFPDAIDSEGNAHPISHGTYSVLLRSSDRKLRESTFKTYHNTFLGYENTMAELLQGAVERNVFAAKSHNFSTALDGALYPKNIDTKVYLSLIQAVRDNIAPLHEYYELRAKILKIDSLHMWDMQVPITPDLEIRKNYKESEELIIESVLPLGEEYQSLLKKGLVEERWVDRYENKNKRSGAYSSGSYDTQPFILMNYKDILRDTFTLAHEAGHSMHSLFSHRNQPYHYSDYPIFLAEVASTFNEDLLSRLLLKKSSSKQEKIFIINQKLEDIKSTLFRQTMFAEFELKIHEWVENDIPLTPERLKDEYASLVKFYFGNSVVIDKEIEIEWARIPHFYYGFYVYQYATGISAALALSDRVTKGGLKERDEYLNFLKSGCSRYPIETLKIAGVDMASDAPIKAAINHFKELTKELALLV